MYTHFMMGGGGKIVGANASLFPPKRNPNLTGKTSEVCFHYTRNKNKRKPKTTSTKSLTLQWLATQGPRCPGALGHSNILCTALT